MVQPKKITINNAIKIKIEIYEQISLLFS